MSSIRRRVIVLCLCVNLVGLTVMAIAPANVAAVTLSNGDLFEFTRMDTGTYEWIGGTDEDLAEGSYDLDEGIVQIRADAGFPYELAVAKIRLSKSFTVSPRCVYTNGYVHMEGEYWGKVSAHFDPFISGGLAALQYSLILWDITDGGALVHWIQLMYIQNEGGWDEVDSGLNSYSETLCFWTQAGHKYEVWLEAYVWAEASLFAAAHADCWGEQFLSVDNGYFYIRADATSCCAAEGTMITMMDGSEKPIEDIRIGDVLLGYDTENCVFTEERVIEIYSTYAMDMVSFNNGALELTLTDHPVYVKDYEGNAFWVWDPRMIVEGWSLYQPLSDRWVLIDSIELEHKKVPVYDFITDNVRTYIGNSYLLMDKGKK